MALGLGQACRQPVCEKVDKGCFLGESMRKKGNYQIAKNVLVGCEVGQIFRGLGGMKPNDHEISLLTLGESSLSYY